MTPIDSSFYFTPINPYSELITRTNSPELEPDYNAVNTENDSIAHSQELLEHLSYLSISETHEDIAPAKKAMRCNPETDGS